MDLLLYCLALIMLGLLRTKEAPTDFKKTKNGELAPVPAATVNLPIGQNLQLARITGAYTYILKELGLR